jgi:serine/threonine protein kinase
MGWRDVYDVIETIKSGSIGDVFVVRHRATGDDLAIKELKRQHLLDEEAYYRFTREIEIMRGLNHPNIVPILDVGLDASPPYYEMPKYDASLKDLYSAGSTQTQTIKNLILPIIRAVDYLHKRQLAHRDLHPGNILFDGSTFLISDFSLGKFIGIDSFHTHSSLGGVQGYAAPEQFAANREVNTLADIYALGGLLIFVTSGRHPFEVSLDTLPFEYRAIIQRCRETEPPRRFHTVQELEDALDRLWNHERSWEIRERLRREATSTAVIDRPDAAIQDLLSCSNDEWQTVVRYLLEIENEELLKLVTLGEFNILLEALSYKAQRPIVLFKHLDPMGEFLGRVAGLAHDCALVVKCAVIAAKIGHRHDQYSFRKFFERIYNEGERFPAYQRLLEVELLSLSDESKWLNATRRSSQLRR